MQNSVGTGGEGKTYVQNNVIYMQGFTIQGGGANLPS